MSETVLVVNFPFRFKNLAATEPGSAGTSWPSPPNLGERFHTHSDMADGHSRRLSLRAWSPIETNQHVFGHDDPSDRHRDLAFGREAGRTNTVLDITDALADQQGCGQTQPG